MRSVTKILAYPLLLSACQVVLAQTVVDTLPGKTDILPHQLEDLEVVASPVKREVTASSPSFAIDGKDLQRRGIIDLTDAIHRLPGVNIRDYGGAGGMKTVSVRGFGAEHTGVVYDGIVLSDCQSGSIDLSRYSLDNVKSMSLIIGDNSDIFITAKAASSAATLHLNTISVPESEDKEWKLKAQFKTGSWGLINPYLLVGKTLTEKFSWSAIGDYTHVKNDYPFIIKNGILTSHERRNHSMMNSGHGELNFKYRFSPDNSLMAKIYYYDNDRQLPGPVVLYTSEGHETLHDRNFFSQLTWETSLPHNLQLRAHAKFNWDCSFYYDKGASYPGGENHENYWQREAYVAGALMWQPFKEWTFDYSADYFYNSLNSNQIDNPRPWRHSILQSLTGRWKSRHVMAMARLLLSVYDNEVHDGESAKDATKLSPSLSVSVQPWSSRLFFVRASYKNIFRMPTFNDSYYFRLGSTQLKPESTNQINIGLTWQMPFLTWLPVGTFTIDAYYNQIKDKIIAIPRTMYVWTMTNLDKARAFGVDATVDFIFRPAKRHDILVNGTYSFQRVQPRTSPLNPDYNKQVAYTPVHSGSFSVGYENPWINLSVHATGVSERFGINSNPPSSRIAGYVDFGLTLWRDFKLKGHTIGLRGDILNLFNKQYEVVARYPMPGRSWRLSVKFEF